MQGGRYFWGFEPLWAQPHTWVQNIILDLWFPVCSMKLDFKFLQHEYLCISFRGTDGAAVSCFNTWMILLFDSAAFPMMLGRGVHWLDLYRKLSNLNPVTFSLWNLILFLWCRYHFDGKFLAMVSSKICNSVRGINRVVYDITSKPPSTVEWEWSQHTRMEW